MAAACSPAELQEALQQTFIVTARLAKERCSHTLYSLLHPVFPKGHKGRQRQRDLGCLTLTLSPANCDRKVPAIINLNGVKQLSDVFERELVWKVGQYPPERLGSKLCWKSVKKWRHQYQLYQDAVPDAGVTLAESLVPEFVDLASMPKVDDADRKAILMSAVGRAGSWTALVKDHISAAMQEFTGALSTSHK